MSRKETGMSVIKVYLSYQVHEHNALIVFMYHTHAFINRFKAILIQSLTNEFQ